MSWADPRKVKEKGCCAEIENQSEKPEKKRNKKERAGAPIHKRCAGPSVWKPFFILGTVTKLINYLVG